MTDIEDVQQTGKKATSDPIGAGKQGLWFGVGASLLAGFGLMVWRLLGRRATNAATNLTSNLTASATDAADRFGDSVTVQGPES